MTDWANRITFRVSSADPDADFPVWVDLSDYLLTSGSPFDFRLGRQNDLDQAEPAQVDILLLNNDDRFTYGNTSSPYTSWWGPGRLCQIQELVGGLTLDRFTGYLQIPTEAIMSAGLQQVVRVSAVDRLGRLATVDPFVSTLAAHILGSGGTALVDYWPFSDQGSVFTNARGGPRMETSTGRTAAAYSGEPEILSGSGTPLPGDDIAPLRLVPANTGTTTSACVNMQALYSVLLAERSLAAGQVLTVVTWVNLDLTLDEEVNVITVSTSDGPVVLSRRPTGDAFAPLAWRLTKPVGTLTGSVNSTLLVGSYRYYMLGLRFGFSTNLIEMWVDGDIYTGTLTGVLAGPAIIDAVYFGPNFLGSVAHMQMYLGSSTDWDNDDFLAQRTVGLLGLERQTTGERIKSIARYAGLPNWSFVNTIDPGQSVMQAATLAGQTPLDAMRDAVRTEQGLLYVDGSGRLVFKDRRTLYNI